MTKCDNYRYFHNRYFHNKDLDLTEAPACSDCTVHKAPALFLLTGPQAASPQWLPCTACMDSGHPTPPSALPLPCTHAHPPAATRPSGTRPVSCSSPHRTPRASCQPLCWLCGCPCMGTHAGGSRECSSALRVRHGDKVRGADSLADAKTPLRTASFQPRGEHLATTLWRLRTAKQTLGQRLTCHAWASREAEAGGVC